MNDQWEAFCDVGYYHMWRLRRKTERGWNDGFHINTRDEAEGLCELLNKLEREVDDAREQCSNLDDQVSAAMMVIRGMERERDEVLSDLEFRRDLFKLQEQQLNDVRAERDRLAEALRELWKNHTLHGAAYELIEQTLAAVKGGSDE